MVRLKTPKKEVGKTFDYEGHLIECKLTGKSFNGVPSTAWFHINGEQAFRSVNGAITFIEPSETAVEQTHRLPKVSDKIFEKYDGRLVEEQYVFELAWNIAKQRYPDMNDKTDIFGMIVNSIVTRLITI
jgi:hypothetical protein